MSIRSDRKQTYFKITEFAMILAGVVNVTGTFSASALAQEPAREEHWYRCNTHAHPDGANGEASIEGAVQWYKSHGYQCLVIEPRQWTAVDAVNKKFGANPPFLVISGEEISQGVEGNRIAHVNGINTNKDIPLMGDPPDYAPPGVSMAEAYIRNINEVYAAGGIPQINHPAGLWGVHLEDLLPIQRPFLFEVWNGVPSIGNLGGEDEKGVVTPSFEALWDGLLSHGKMVWGVAVDDTHTYTDWCDLTAALP